MKISVNGTLHQVNVEEGTPLLWVLRDELNLTGTKYGCGIASCGACTVIIDGQPVRSCQTFIEDVKSDVTTIEKQDASEPLLTLQRAWIQHQVAQCGYCQSGQIMTAVTLLQNTPLPTDAQIDEAMSGNLCRCGTYPRLRAAIHDAARQLQES